MGNQPTIDPSKHKRITAAGVMLRLRNQSIVPCSHSRWGQLPQSNRSPDFHSIIFPVSYSPDQIPSLFLVQAVRFPLKCSHLAKVRGLSPLLPSAASVFSQVRWGLSMPGTMNQAPLHRCRFPRCSLLLLSFIFSDTPKGTGKPERLFVFSAKLIAHYIRAQSDNMKQP